MNLEETASTRLPHEGGAERGLRVPAHAGRLEEIKRIGAKDFIRSLTPDLCRQLRGAVDLHVHSHYSDASDAPEKVIGDAVHRGVVLLALTDHDTVRGWSEAFEAAEGKPIVVVPGIEISAKISGFGVHILGLCLERDLVSNDPEFADKLAGIASAREKRVADIVKSLNAYLVDKENVPLHELITFEEVKRAAGRGIVTRGHIRLPLQEGLEKAGYGADEARAETRRRAALIGRDGPAYIDYDDGMVYEAAVAIEKIKSLGGIPVLAHPSDYRRLSRENIRDMKDAGLEGMEVFNNYPKDKGLARTLEEWLLLCGDCQLFPSVGSDYHGRYKPVKLGEWES